MCQCRIESRSHIDVLHYVHCCGDTSMCILAYMSAAMIHMQTHVRTVDSAQYEHGHVCLQ